MPPVKTLGKISKYVDGLPIPRLSFEEVFNSLEEGDERPKLQVAKLVELNDEDLQTILYHYGAGKAFLESELSDIESKTALVEYSSLYSAVSRVITLRTYDKKEYNK